MEPQVSVIIPIFNVEKYVKKCMESVVNQTLKNIEIICVNDCCTDNSMIEVEKFAKNDLRIKILNHLENKGLGPARNTGLDAATGKYIMFLDSDDWLELNACEVAYKQISLNSNDFVYFGTNIYNDFTGITTLDETRLKAFDGNFSVKKLKLSQMDKPYMAYCECWYKIYKNSFLKQNNIKFSNNHAKYEDQPFYFNALLYADTVSIINKPLYNYRIRETSISQSVKSWDDLIKTRKLILDQLLKSNLVYEKFIFFYAVSCVYSLLGYYNRFADKDKHYKKHMYQTMKEFFILLDKKISLNLISGYIDIQKVNKIMKLNYTQYKKFDANFNLTLNKLGLYIMKIFKKILQIALNFTNKFISFFTLGKAKIYVTTDSNNPLIRYQDIRGFIYKPLKSNYLNKILFIEYKFKNLYSVYEYMLEKYGQNTCDYIYLKSERDFNDIKKIYDYKIIVVNEELKFLDKISKKNQMVICVWHALGAFKKVGKYLSFVFKTETERKFYEPYFNYLLVSGEKIRKLYADALNMKIENVISLGLPQVDKYFDENYIKRIRNDFFQKNKNLKNKKIYGFFPTIQDGTWSSNWNINFKKMASLLNDDEIVVYKIHPAVANNKTDFYEVKNKVINLSHISNLISACNFDAIITDYSSIIFEAMIFNINFVFFRSKLTEYQRGLWVDYENLPGNIIDSNTSIDGISIEEIILKNLRNKYNNSKKYKDFYDKNIGKCDSKSSQRIAIFLLQKLKEIK